MKLRLTLPLLSLLAAPDAFAFGQLEKIFSDPITTIFIGVIAVLTVVFTFLKFDRFAVVHGPEILTTVGIFGCFFGIATALLHFDASNVSESVPHLLEGVKTAFWASVSGVFGSLFIRGRHFFTKKPIRQTEGAPKSATLDDVVAAIQALQLSLSGKEEGSLLTQLKLMRQEQNDELRKLRDSFDTFAQRMSEDGSKALIEALKEVIKDFNAQINEQFGENFKQLNAAVEKLVIWQRQYKEELDQLQSVQKSSAEDMRQCASSLASFIDRAARFSEIATALDSTLQGLARQHEMIDESQRSMATVLEKMKNVTPEFSQKIDLMTESMKQSVTKLHEEVAEVVQTFGVQVTNTLAEMKALISDTLKKSQSEVHDGLTKSMEAVRQSVIMLDRGLEKELSDSLVSLGRQLTSLSEKFVTDYTPLTERLREVVRMAGKA